MTGSRRRILLSAITAMITLTCCAVGQEIPRLRPPDTTFLPRESPGFESLFTRPTAPFALTPAKGQLDFSMFLRQSLFQAFQPGERPDQHLTTLRWLWTSEATRGSAYRTLGTIVGAMEAGAVAYLAYRHLKRYGLK